MAGEEDLVVKLTARLGEFERQLARSKLLAADATADIERRFSAMKVKFPKVDTTETMTSVTALRTAFASIGGALVAKQVTEYASAWTSITNSLRVAGLEGAKLQAVQEQLFAIAQKQGAPIESLATLFGRAAQTAKELGATEGDLIRFTGGVATALKVAGTDATQASGALLQLSQLLGSARVAAEEFNSVNEGARPILQAVANGLKEAGGSVAKLKQLVTDGKVSNRDFFEAFLKGLPTIEAQADRAAETIGQAYVKVRNALTKYVGQTDEGLSASQRLVQGLNALADNFDKTADAVLKVASVVAAAFVGRAIGGMIASLGMSTAALVQFVGALRAAQTAAAAGSAFGGLAAAAGPLGAIIGTVVVGALMLFATRSSEASQGAKLYAEALRQIQAEASKTGTAVDNVNTRLQEQQTLFLNQAIRAAEADYKSTMAAIDAVIGPLDQLMTRLKDGSAIKAQMEEFRNLRDRLREGSISADDAKERLAALANINPSQFEALANGLIPLIEKLAQIKTAADKAKAALAGVGKPGDAPSFRSTEIQSLEAYEGMRRVGDDLKKNLEERNRLSKGELEIVDKISEVRKKAADKGGYISTEDATKLAKETIAAEERRKEKTSSGPKAVRRTADDTFDRDVESIKNRTAALLLEQQVIGKGVAEQETRRMALEMEQRALQHLQETARRNGDEGWRNVQLTDTQKQKIKEVSEAYGQQAAKLQELQEKNQRAQQAAEDFYSSAKTEFTDAILGAKSFGDALEALKKKFLSLALNGLFDSLFKPPGGGGGFGFLSSIFRTIFGGGLGGSAPAMATGGEIRGAGTGTSDSIPIWASNGEFMVNAESTKKFLPLLRAINEKRLDHRALHFAKGGTIGVPDLAQAPTVSVAPAVSAPAGMRSAPTVVQPKMAINIQNYGSTQPRVEQRQESDGTTVWDVVIPAMEERMAGNMRRGQGALAHAADARVRNTHLRG